MFGVAFLLQSSVETAQLCRKRGKRGGDHRTSQNPAGILQGE
jgi:hypothetical protein